MGREKKNVPGAPTGDHAKERHKRNRKGNLMDWSAPLPPGLVARPEKPRISSKHKSWFEFIENKDKKKKLEFEFTEKREPPPGFEFVPIGNPALTTACKELSREQGAMIFIVTSSQGQFSKKLSLHLNRAGHHIRQSIVEQARASLGEDQLALPSTAPGQPEPIPERQEDINKQADAAIRDLFPRIPNTDRQTIIEHAFNKSRLNKGEPPPVGLAAHLTLSRRVQLAVLAHIRHNHTRYDQLLRETTYVNARKAVEPLCLDILVKWRGDEETGRDQLDEILCEVVVISDSESDESDEDNDGDDDDSTGTSSTEDSSSGPSVPDSHQIERLSGAPHAPRKVQKVSRKDRRAAKWAQRGFSRYQAARDQAWNQAVERQRLRNGGSAQVAGYMPPERFASHEPHPWRTDEPERLAPGPTVTRSPVETPYHERPHSYRAPLPPVGAHYERMNRVDEAQQAGLHANYHAPRRSPVERTPQDNEFRPIVGSQPPLHYAPEAERIRHHGEDLKDFIVQSIEPASPQSSNRSPRFPVHLRQPDPYLTRGVEAPVRVVTQSRDPGAPNGDATSAQRFHAACSEEGFVRLPPRSGTSRVPTAPTPRSEPFIHLNAQPANTVVGSALTAAPGGSGLRHSSTYHDSEPFHGRRPMLQSGGRPCWIGDDGAILRSESRPIVIQGDASPFREPMRYSTYTSSDTHLRSPNRWSSDSPHAGHGWVGESDRQHASSRIDQRMETLQGDFVEIVRVSNKFPRQYEPRQYEPRAIPVHAARHDLPAPVTRQNAPREIDDSVGRYSFRQLPTHTQRAEWQTDAIRRPGFRQEDVPLVVRQPDGYANQVQRRERVVGIEYVQTRPSFESGAFSDRVPSYDGREPAYRPRSASITTYGPV